jgi:hypothetical protein
MVEWNEELHPRVPKGTKGTGGQFASKGGSGGGSNARKLPLGLTPVSSGAVGAPSRNPYRGAAGVINETRDKLTKAGFKFGKVSDLPPTTGEFGTPKEPKNVTPAHGLIAQGFVIAKEEALPGTILHSILKGRSAPTIVFADLNPEVGALTVMRDNKIHFIVNTNHNAEEEILWYSKILEDNPGTSPLELRKHVDYSTLMGVTFYHETRDMKLALLAVGLAGAVHEMAHAANYYGMKVLLVTWGVAMARIAMEHGITDATSAEDTKAWMKDWAGNNISWYAAESGGEDAMAETVAMWVMEKKMPHKHLEAWAKHVIDQVPVPKDGANG